MTSPAANPYVGPRTFTTEQAHLFFGREAEAAQLLAVVISERLTLFYAQSGAGKSSLLHARLIPNLKAAGILTLPVGRVSGQLPPGVSQVDNIFAFNLMASLDNGQGDPNRFSRVSLSHFLARLTSRDGRSFYYDEQASPPAIAPAHSPDYVLIIDQFEEILTSHTERWPERADFFKQLDQAMAADPLLRVVLTLREDYVAGLDPYSQLLAGKLRARFYMQRMGYDAALKAVKNPAQAFDRPFAPGVAESLVDNLRQIRSQTPLNPPTAGGSSLPATGDSGDPPSAVSGHTLGQYVEPVQLQVVCYQLWENLKDRPAGEISPQDFQELGNVDTALAQFYEQAIAKVSTETGKYEGYLREWFKSELITEARTRGTVFRGQEKTGGLANEAVDLLVNQFLLRPEIRAGGTWYELVHDRFVDPILKSNQAWGLQHQSSFSLEVVDDSIITELAQREETIDVDQTATYQLTIVNGSPIVASFDISVMGLDESWVAISRSSVNLNEGMQETETIMITPPRRPTSRAGAHQFTVGVTSPNLPGRSSQRRAALIINPYYEFAVNELSPRQLVVSWFKRSGQAILSIVNKSNSDAHFKLFMLTGTEQPNYSLEFEVPGEEIMRAEEVELNISADSSLAIPIRVTPYTRSLIGLHSRRYDFTIIANILEGQQASRSQLGQLSQRPLIGPLPLALMLLLLACSVLFWIRPTIYLFRGDPQRVRAGEEVTLRWSASPFANLRINHGIGPVEGTVGETIVVPENDVVYELKAENWLSVFSPSWFSYSKEVAVQVEPVMPIILQFSIDKEAILTGEEITLSWEVQSTDELILLTNGSPETILSTEQTSRRTLSPVRDTTYTLVARNRFGEITQSVVVRVILPTATPFPTPLVKKFVINPSVIVAGTPVVVEWEVEGADTVSVQPIGDNLPPIQLLSQEPQQDTTYVLNAAKGPLASQPIAIQVFVTPAPTPTPQANAPVITFFSIVPERATSSNTVDVELAWSISGEFTNIQISSPHYNTISDLDRESSIILSVDKTTVFVLSAFNGDLVSSSMVGVRVSDGNVSIVAPTVTPSQAATVTATPAP